MVRAAPGGGGSIAAIDPQLMAQMNRSIKNGGETLVNQGGNLKSQFSNLYLDTSPLAEIVSIGNWAHDQLPMLTRRQTLAAAIDDTPGAHFYDEYATGMYLSPAQAAQQGSDLARQFMELNSTDAEGARRAHEIALELASHKDDRAFTSAFYGTLGPQRTKIIPIYMTQSGSQTAADDLKIYSHALGTALSAPYPAPGMDKIRSDFERASSNRPEAWNKGAMLADAKVPGSWLGKVAWQVFRFEGGNVIDDWVQGGESRTDELENRRRQASLASSYLIAAKLMDHGYPMAAQPDASANQWAQDNDVDPSKARFTDAGGHLLPPDQILADNDKLAAYDAWLEANGRGGSHDDAFGQKTVDLANSQQGAFTRTVDRYGPDS